MFLHSPPFCTSPPSLTFGEVNVAFVLILLFVNQYNQPNAETVAVTLLTSEPFPADPLPIPVLWHDPLKGLGPPAREELHIGSAADNLRGEKFSPLYPSFLSFLQTTHSTFKRLSGLAPNLQALPLLLPSSISFPPHLFASHRPSPMGTS